MIRSKNRLALGLAAGAVALALAGCSGGASGGSTAAPTPAPTETGAERVDSPGVTATTVSIGTISDQTGPTTGIQLPWLHGVQAAIEAVNAEGGINGRTIEIIAEDDKYDAAVGQPAFKKLVDQTPVAAILGLNTGNMQAAVLPSIETGTVPVLSGQTTILDAINPVKEYFFGLAPTYADQVDAILAYAPERLGKEDFSVVVVHNGAATGVEVEELTKERAVGGIELLGSVVLESAATSADAQLQTVIGLDPDLVLFHGSGAGVNLFNRAQEKFDTHYPLIGISPSGGPGAFAGVTPEFGNLYEYVQWAYPVPIEAPGTAAMVEAAEAVGFGEEVNNPDFVAGYAGGLVIIEAIRVAGENPSREAIAAALSSMSGFSTGGITADVSFSATDRVGIQEFVPLKWNYETSSFEIAE